IYARTFAPTSLTEPLGLVWALFAIPFLIEAWRTGSLAHALLGLAAITAALMTRMGSMFSIPAVMLWLVWQFGRTVREEAIAAALAATVVIAIVSMNGVLQRLYGGHTATGSNLSYTLCGISIGTAWDGCPRRIIDEGGQLPPSEQGLNELLYSLAWQNFKA